MCNHCHSNPCLPTCPTVRYVSCPPFPVPPGPMGPQGKTGPTGPIGPAGLSSLFANAIFVDSQFGNDSNAAAFNFADSTVNPTSHKFQTIGAARVTAMNLSPKPAIIVYPGSYSDANLYGDGLTYYFYPGATVTTNGGFIFAGNNPGESCRVFGKANFDGGFSGVVGTFTPTNYLYFEANNITADVDAVTIHDGNLEVHANDINSNFNAGVQIVDSVDQTGINSLLVVANTIRNQSPYFGTNGPINNVTSNTGFCGKAKIIANRIIGSPNNDSNIVTFDNFNVAGGAEIEIISDIETSFPGGGNAIVYFNFHNNTKTIIKGNIIRKGGSQPGILTNGNNNGTVIDFEGDITTGTAPAIITGGTEPEFHTNGFIDANSSDTVVLSSVGARVYMDGTVQNTSPGANGISKTVATPVCDLLIGNLKIVTAGGTSIQAPGDTVKVVHSLATNAPSNPVMPGINSLNPLGLANLPVAYTDINIV